MYVFVYIYSGVYKACTQRIDIIVESVESWCKVKGYFSLIVRMSVRYRLNLFQP